MIVAFPKSARDGFTLIEIAIVLALLSTSVVIVGGYFVNMSQNAQTMARYEACLNEAESTAEYIRALPWDRLCTESPVPDWDRPEHVEVHVVAIDASGEPTAIPCGDREGLVELRVIASSGSMRVVLPIVKGPGE